VKRRIPPALAFSSAGPFQKPVASPDNARRIANEQVNAIIKGYADGDKVIWCDFNAKFLDGKGDTKWIMPDRLHPGDAGYKIWTESVLPYFKTVCGK